MADVREDQDLTCAPVGFELVTHHLTNCIMIIWKLMCIWRFLIFLLNSLGSQKDGSSVLDCDLCLPVIADAVDDASDSEMRAQEKVSASCDPPTTLLHPYS